MQTYRIQSRTEFFFKNFLVRYLRYRFDKGMLDVTVIRFSPVEKKAIFEVQLCARGKIRTIARDFHVVSKLPSLAVDLNTIVQILLESSTVEDTIVGGT